MITSFESVEREFRRDGKGASVRVGVWMPLATRLASRHATVVPGTSLERNPAEPPMRNFVIRLLANAAALWVAARLVGGVSLTEEVGGILWVALIFGLINALVKPVVMLLSFPVIFLTLGLFVFVVNAVLFMFTASLTDALSVSGFGAALLGSVVVSLVAMILNGALREAKKD